MSGIKLPAIERPNGKTYRPRKIVVEPIERPDGGYAVIVFGTHDVEFAWPLATTWIKAETDPQDAAGEPRVGWWRDGYIYGERTWIPDDDLGRAGVWFTAVDDPALSAPTDTEA